MYQSRCVAPGANLLAQLPPLHPAQLIFLLVLSGTEQLQLQKLQLGSRLVGFSAQYQQTLLRLSPIAIAQNRAERFRALAEEMDWSWTTSLTYWRAILTLMTLLNMPLTVDDRGLSRLLAKEAALAPTWSHEDPTQILSTMAIKALTEAMASTSTGDPLRAAYVAMMLGQRVSDVLRLKRENVFIQHFAKHTDTQQSVHTVVLKFVETKTSLKCGHFTLAIPYGTHVATLLIEDRSCSTEEYLYISNRVEVLKAEAEIHKKLLEILGFKVDLRAMRRTGLSRLASSGAELPTVLQISRHRTLEMLERYLSGGLYHGAVHRQQSMAFTNAWIHELPERSKQDQRRYISG